jgi:hypothetical protein
MNVLNRILTFWGPPKPDDHPLTEQERAERHSATAYDERALTVEDFISGDFDPDEPASGKLD